MKIEIFPNGRKTRLEGFKSGKAEAEIVVANLNTLLSAAETVFSNLDGKILLIEEMAAPWSKEERNTDNYKWWVSLNKLRAILGKPEDLTLKGHLLIK